MLKGKIPIQVCLIHVHTMDEVNPYQNELVGYPCPYSMVQIHINIAIGIRDFNFPHRIIYRGLVWGARKSADGAH